MNVPEWLLKRFDEGRVAIFCGAGISIPSKLPGGIEFGKAVIEECFRGDAYRLLRDEVVRVYAKMGFPIEALFDLMSSAKTVLPLFEVFEQGRPNLKQETKSELLVSLKNFFVNLR